MPKKFDQDAKDRVVRLVEDRVLAENLSLQKACSVVAPRLGVSWHTARQRVQCSRREGRVHRLEEDVIVENARLRRAANRSGSEIRMRNQPTTPQSEPVRSVLKAIQAPPQTREDLAKDLKARAEQPKAERDQTKRLKQHRHGRGR